MKSRTKKIAFSILAIIIIIIGIYLYIQSVRSNAIEAVKKTYREELALIREDYDLPKFDDNTLDSYYIPLADQYDGENQGSLISSEVAFDLMSFIATYNEYWSFNYLKEYIE
ncbi:uncharacterized protein YpmB [Breznakia sp. PF5-3]|uniref:hypothetical protein n=1 Tax=unclassified Breznakia TaxID=2623764 RepID=UPI0024067CF9|nr:MULTISPECIES: hypothetical protein [unclassified Breznakia]MDF9824773.1 uncharacterized protein YpmB [Breznakia sp. PM6-1]MDF9835771.1 uncharacterized protein YpmB [Breznakia sp. PF5-3]MDF9837857.1 uncharacterized protein YpmB [Breznakia sp. PFB2-8]MDF9859772.1 uncharacterized protein YpmB [Breznakia sp. PH5-24]